MSRQLLTLWLLINLQLAFLVTAVLKIFFKLFPVRNRVANTLLILESLPIENAGYQYRVAKWIPHFAKQKWQLDIWTIIASRKSYDYLTQPENISRYLIHAMWLRLRQVVASMHYSCVIVRRELLQYNDYGNCFMEQLLSVIHPMVILDIDDNIAEAKREPRVIQSWFGKLNREDGSKFMNSLSYYHSFIVGTPHLMSYVQSLYPSKADNSFCFIPTCVDYDIHAPRTYGQQTSKIVFGWIGGVSNLAYLDFVIPALNEIANGNAIELQILSGADFVPKTTPIFPIINLKWSLDNEVDYIKSWDIGLMPLPQSKLANGKSGFKLLQYMGLGLVSVANDVGINGEIIQSGSNGFLVTEHATWNQVLKEILAKKADWSSIGTAARKSIEEKYTFHANAQKYIQFISSR
jgi:glycosyltransferase involved in cell wall biosynthesis